MACLCLVDYSKVKTTTPSAQRWLCRFKFILYIGLVRSCDRKVYWGVYIILGFVLEELWSCYS